LGGLCSLAYFGSFNYRLFSKIPYTVVRWKLIGFPAYPHDGTGNRSLREFDLFAFPEFVLEEGAIADIANLSVEFKSIVRFRSVKVATEHVDGIVGLWHVIARDGIIREEVQISNDRRAGPVETYQPERIGAILFCLFLQRQVHGPKRGDTTGRHTDPPYVVKSCIIKFLLYEVKGRFE